MDVNDAPVDSFFLVFDMDPRGLVVVLHVGAADRWSNPAPYPDLRLSAAFDWINCDNLANPFLHRTTVHSALQR